MAFIFARRTLEVLRLPMTHWRPQTVVLLMVLWFCLDLAKRWTFHQYGVNIIRALEVPSLDYRKGGLSLAGGNSDPQAAAEDDVGDSGNLERITGTRRRCVTVAVTALGRNLDYCACYHKPSIEPVELSDSLSVLISSTKESSPRFSLMSAGSFKHVSMTSRSCLSKLE